VVVNRQVDEQDDLVVVVKRVVRCRRGNDLPRTRCVVVLEDDGVGIVVGNDSHDHALGPTEDGSQIIVGGSRFCLNTVQPPAVNSDSARGNGQLVRFVEAEVSNAEWLLEWERHEPTPWAEC
jgi:hypothetical protein